MVTTRKLIEELRSLPNIIGFGYTQSGETVVSDMSSDIKRWIEHLEQVELKMKELGWIE